MQANIDLVLKDMGNQIATLAQDKAIYYALAVQREEENKQLKEEIEQLKKPKEVEAN